MAGERIEREPWTLAERIDRFLQEPGHVDFGCPVSGMGRERRFAGTRIARREVIHSMVQNGQNPTFMIERKKLYEVSSVERELVSSFFLTFEAKGLTPFPQAMPDEYKCEGDPVKAYRAFYLGEKMKFAKWTKRPKPAWVK